MKTLLLKFKKYGFTYVQVLRGKRSFVFEKKLTPEISYFEVFIRRVEPSVYILGKFFDEREIFPRDEDFSKWAWCYSSLEDALKKFIELERGIY